MWESCSTEEEAEVHTVCVCTLLPHSLWPLRILRPSQALQAWSLGQPLSASLAHPESGEAIGRDYPHLCLPRSELPLTFQGLAGSRLGRNWKGTWMGLLGRHPVSKCWPTGGKHLKWLSGIFLKAFICNPGRACFLKGRWKCIPAVLRRPHLEGSCSIKALLSPTAP